MGRVDILSRRRLFDDIFKIDAATISFERIRRHDVAADRSPRLRARRLRRGPGRLVMYDRSCFTEQFRLQTVTKGPRAG